MRSDKNLAIKLRKSGQSYNQISRALNIPKSTLSTWLKDLAISQEAESKIMARVHSTSIAKLVYRNKQQTVAAKKRHEEILKQAEEESLKLISDPLFVCGTCLYWGEGYKRSATGGKQKNIDFANSDPEKIKMMMKFFKKFLITKEVEISIQLMIHEPKNAEKAINFWHNLTKVPKKNFTKPSFAISRMSSGKRGQRLEHGTVHLRIYDVNKFFRLIGWINGIMRNIN